MRTSFYLVLLSVLVVAAATPMAIAKQAPAPTIGHGAAQGTLFATVEASGTGTTSTQTPAAPTEPTAPRTREDMVPVQIAIPSIDLNDPVEKMGVLKNGEMAVPSGSTDNVGWYAAGTVPGKQGSAVFDAHVFAAFRNLNQVKAGDEILVKGADGGTLRFRVETTEVFKLQNLSADYLFSRNDQKRLTLITCAGKLTSDHSTYTHRLVVSAVLE